MEQLHDLLSRWARLEPGRCIAEPIGSLVYCWVGLHREIELELSNELNFTELALLQAHVQAAVEARGGWDWTINKASVDPETGMADTSGEPMWMSTIRHPSGRRFGVVSKTSPALALLAAYVAALEAVTKTQEVKHG